MRNVQETEIIRISLENQNIAHILLFEAFKSTWALSDIILKWKPFFKKNIFYIYGRGGFNI